MMGPDTSVYKVFGRHVEFQVSQDLCEDAGVGSNEYSSHTGCMKVILYTFRPQRLFPPSFVCTRGRSCVCNARIGSRDGALLLFYEMLKSGISGGSAFDARSCLFSRGNTYVYHGCVYVCVWRETVVCVCVCVCACAFFECRRASALHNSAEHNPPPNSFSSLELSARAWHSWQSTTIGALPRKISPRREGEKRVRGLPEAHSRTAIRCQ